MESKDSLDGFSRKLNTKKEGNLVASGDFKFGENSVLFTEKREDCGNSFIASIVEIPKSGVEVLKVEPQKKQCVPESLEDESKGGTFQYEEAAAIQTRYNEKINKTSVPRRNAFKEKCSSGLESGMLLDGILNITNNFSNKREGIEQRNMPPLKKIRFSKKADCHENEVIQGGMLSKRKETRNSGRGFTVSEVCQSEENKLQINVVTDKKEMKSINKSNETYLDCTGIAIKGETGEKILGINANCENWVTSHSTSLDINSQKIVFGFLSENKEREKGLIRSENVQNDVNSKNIQIMKTEDKKGGEMKRLFCALKTSETTDQMSNEQIISKETLNNLTRYFYEKKYDSNPVSVISDGSGSKVSEIPTFENAIPGPTFPEIMSSVEMKQRISHEKLHEIVQQRKLYIPMKINIPDLEPFDTDELNEHMLQPHQPPLLKLERANSQIGPRGIHFQMNMNKVFMNAEESSRVQEKCLSISKNEISSQSEQQGLLTLAQSPKKSLLKSELKDKNQIITSAQLNEELGVPIIEMLKYISCNRDSILINKQECRSDDHIDETDYEVAAITDGIFLSKSEQSNETGEVFLPLEVPELLSPTKARDIKLRELFSNLWNKLLRNTEKATVEDLQRKILNAKRNTRITAKKCTIEELIQKYNVLRRKSCTKKEICKLENNDHIEQPKMVPSINMKSQYQFTYYDKVEDSKLIDKYKGENNIYNNNENTGSFEGRDSKLALPQSDDHACAFTAMRKSSPSTDFSKQDVKLESAASRSQNSKSTNDCQSLKSDISPFDINVKPWKTRCHEAKSLDINPVVVGVDVHSFPREQHSYTSYDGYEILNTDHITDNQQLQKANGYCSLSSTINSGKSVKQHEISQAVVSHEKDVTSVVSKYGSDYIQNTEQMILNGKRKLPLNASFEDADLETGYKRSTRAFINFFKNTQKLSVKPNYESEKRLKEATFSFETGTALSEASCSSWEFQSSSSHSDERRMRTRTKFETSKSRGGESKRQRGNKWKDVINENTVHISENSRPIKDTCNKMKSDLDSTSKEIAPAEVNFLTQKTSKCRSESFQVPFGKKKKAFLNGVQKIDTSSTSDYINSLNMTTNESGFSKPMKTCYTSEISSPAEIYENDPSLYNTVSDDYYDDGDVASSLKYDQIYEGSMLASSGLNKDLQNFYEQLGFKSTSAEESRRLSHQSTSPLIFEPKYTSTMIPRRDTDENEGDEDEDYAQPDANHVYCTVGETEENILKPPEPPSSPMTPPSPPPPPRPPPLSRALPTPLPRPRTRPRVRPMPMLPNRGSQNWLQYWMAILAGLSSLSAGFMDAWSYSELINSNPPNNGTVTPYYDRNRFASFANLMAPMDPTDPGPQYNCSGLWNFKTEAPCFKMLVETGTTLGSLIAAFLMKKFGCKTTLLAMTVPAVVSWIIIPYSKSTIKWLYVVRFVSGIVVGVVSIVVPMFNVEIAEIKSRGELSSYSYIMLGFGGVAGVAFASFLPFPLAAIIPCAAPVALLAASQWLHHSPIYLLSQGRASDANSVLRMLRGRPEVTSELQRTQALAELAGSTPPLRPSPWTSRYVPSSALTVRALIAVFGLMCLRQLVGGHVILRYTVDFYEKGYFWYPFESLIIGLVEVSGSIAASIFVDKIGRRVVLLTSSIGVTTCMIALSVFFYLHQQHGITDNIPYLPVILLTTFIGFYGYGLGPIPWLMMAELIPGHHKIWATAVAGFINFVFLFLITQLFPFAIALLGDHIVFPIFSVFCVLACLFIFNFVPETKRKFQNDLQYMLAGAHS